MSVDLSEFRTRQPGPKCGVPAALAALDPDQLEKVMAAFEEKTVQHASIRRVLNEWASSSLSYSTVQRHRTGECHCE